MNKKIIAQYEAIRRLGQTNMLNKNLVQRIAFENEFYELVNAMEEDKYIEIFSNYNELLNQLDEEDIPDAKRIDIEYTLNQNKETKEEISFGNERIRKEVKPFGDGGAHIIAPHHWIDDRVLIIHLSDKEDNND